MESPGTGPISGSGSNEGKSGLFHGGMEEMSLYKPRGAPLILHPVPQINLTTPPSPTRGSPGMLSLWHLKNPTSTTCANKATQTPDSAELLAPAGSGSEEMRLSFPVKSGSSQHCSPSSSL